jgi:hypothetical protein
LGVFVSTTNKQQKKGTVMALTLEANYSKKIGLPQFSSHQFSLTIRTELVDIKQVEVETSRLYALLQSCVDREIQEVGFLPQHGESTNGNGHSHAKDHGNGNGYARNAQRQVTPSRGAGETWACTPKQKDLILNVARDNQVSTQDLEALSNERFGCPMAALNKMQASNFIEELLSKYGKNDNRGRQNGKVVRS